MIDASISQWFTLDHFSGISEEVLKDFEFFCWMYEILKRNK
jgi:hypothetical protein